MTRLSRAVPLAVLLVGTSLTACSRKRASEAPAPAPESADRGIEQPRPSTPQPTNINDDNAARERQMEEMRRMLTAAIYFNFDQAELSTAARSTLDAKLTVLNANPGVRIRVSGHADERGSDEYNMALGQRRAAAARRYLTQRGIDESRVETVSFGEERPTTSGHEESAWSQNRRDEFEVTAGELAVRQ